VHKEPPNAAELQRAAAIFAGLGAVDRSWLALTEQVASGFDLSRADHRAFLLRWLNTWGCRIRYPRDGEPAPFDTGVEAWWREWADRLPSAPLAELDDAAVAGTADAFAALAAVEVSGGKTRRTLGPTAAAKAMFALRPESVMPWDAAIATHLHAARDGAAFARHLRLGRDWARAVQAETGLEGAELSRLLGRAGMPLAKILDEYLYVTITYGADVSAAPSGVTPDDVRAIALGLPRAYEAFVRGRVKFRVGRIVFLALSPDGTELGFGYPKEQRDGLIASDPGKFFLPVPSDMRYNWMRVRLGKIDRDELWELIVDSWAMTVPKSVRERFYAENARPGS
jgi:hypothetical protein